MRVNYPSKRVQKCMKTSTTDNEDNEKQLALALNNNLWVSIVLSECLFPKLDFDRLSYF